MSDKLRTITEMPEHVSEEMLKLLSGLQSGGLENEYRKKMVLSNLHPSLSFDEVESTFDFWENVYSAEQETETLNPRNVIPVNMKTGDRLGYKIIAVISQYDWAAYQGLTSWSDDRVARSGDKISAAVAKMLFFAPDVMGLKYRS